MTEAAYPTLGIEKTGELLRLKPAGRWVTRQLGLLERELEKLEIPKQGKLVLDFTALEALDTAGALLLHRLEQRVKDAGLSLGKEGLTAAREKLMAAVSANPGAVPTKPRPLPAVIALLDRTGRGVFKRLSEAGAMLSFLGETLTVLGRSLAQPWRIRVKAVIRHAETSGLDALPIVGLISFLIGIVLAYQGAEQLARFGAQIFTVNIVGIGVLREMAILLTAIIVAGRSGSAYTAQIGAMQVNEEVDALRTLGLDPMEVLVMPRLIALTLVMPLLCFYADLMGLLGGAVMAWLVLDISLPNFVIQLREAVDVWDFFVGMIKAPLFGFIIATIGCMEGFRVERSAESVGHATTRAVVEGVFLVIVLDGILSIFFQIIGV